VVHRPGQDGDPIAAPRVGIVGAGQLARMLAEAASALGVWTVVLAERTDDAAAAVASEVIMGSPRDASALSALSARCDVVTFDHELVDLDELRGMQDAGGIVRPSPGTLEFAVDKSFQRAAFAAAGLPVPDHVVLDGTETEDTEALRAFADRLGAPPVVKLARGGYDGRGVCVAATPGESESTALSWRRSGSIVVAEAPVAMRRELAALVARRPGGETVTWQVVETAQVGGVCREILVPGNLDARTEAAAEALAHRVADVVGLAGVLAVELFDTTDGLLINEVAARPHNSGHWTIEGSVTSQFENHIRAVLDLPLGATDLTAAATATVNVFGSESGQAGFDLATALANADAKVHLYGKAPRPGRKLGHVTVCGSDPARVREDAWDAAVALGTKRPDQTMGDAR
jgi:5-(carboxyamino)imidazole ribonucleotide synthase